MYDTPVLLLMVGIGGAAGTWARYRFGGAVHARLGSAFPWGTFAVNVLGAFALGVLLPFLEPRAELTPLRAFVTVGCIGAFTTFSTFAFEAAALLRAGARVRAAVYAASTVVVCLVALVAGLGLAGRLG